MPSSPLAQSAPRETARGRFDAAVRAAVTILLALLIATPSLAGANGERARIEALLARMESAHVVFVRNGTRHGAGEAAEHLRMKLRKAGGRITTAESFIDQLASRSSLSGEPYLVELGNGRKVEAGIWLHEVLKDVDAGR